MDLFEADDMHIDSYFPDEDDLEVYVNEESLQHGYLKVRDPKNPNIEISMRKSTFVWHLTEGTKKMSSDRTIRVQNSSHKNASESSKNDCVSALNKVNVNQNVKIGDWCFFKYDTDDKICIGLVFSFKFLKGKKVKEKRHKAEFVDIQEYKEKMTPGKEVAALSSWYFVDSRSHLIPVKKENHFFIEIGNYIATVVKPNVDTDTNVLFFYENDFKDIERDVTVILNN